LGRLFRRVASVNDVNILTLSFVISYQN
jgi:hypothetical protein